MSKKLINDTKLEDLDFFTAYARIVAPSQPHLDDDPTTLYLDIDVLQATPPSLNNHVITLAIPCGVLFVKQMKARMYQNGRMLFIQAQKDEQHQQFTATECVLSR